MPIQLNESRIPEAAGEDWKLLFDSPVPGGFTLEVGTDLKLTTSPVLFDDLSEEAGLHGKRRTHLSEDGEESSVEADCIIPFGAEPAVKRLYTLTGRRLAIRTDLVMRPSFRMNQIDAGDLFVSGAIAGVTVLLPGANHEITEKSWEAPAEGTEIPLNPGESPLSVLIRSVSGALLELSAGEDLWRWNNALRLGGKNGFSLRMEKGGLLFRRKVFQWIPKPDAEPPGGRNWRLCFSVSWSGKGLRKRGGRVKKSEHVFDAAAFDWPPALRAGDGKVCFSAEGTLNILKRWLRQQLETLKKGDVVRVIRCDVSLCGNASHQDRPKKESLLHWDLDAVMEFRRWAVRQTAVKGASFELVPAEDGILAKLPSGMLK